MEEVFETLDTEYGDMTTTCSSKIIEPIVKTKFVNTFHCKHFPSQ